MHTGACEWQHESALAEKWTQTVCSRRVCWIHTTAFPRSLFGVKVGDSVHVRIAEIKDDGKIGLTMLTEEQEAEAKEKRAQSRGGDRNGGGNGGGRPRFNGGRDRRGGGGGYRGGDRGGRR